MSGELDQDLSAVWAGRLELRLKKDTDEYARGFRGAYTTVLVRCENAEQFIAAASQHIDREGFLIGGIEQLFPLASGQFEINGTIEDLINRTREYPVQWTTFHLFKDDA
jgi:hypothetical protein